MSKPQKRVFVLGCGAQGSVIAKEISKEPNVAETICGDIDINRAKRLEQKSDKIRGVQVDGSKVKEILRASTDADLIVNAMPCSFNAVVMEAALEGSMNYQDLASELLQGIPFAKTALAELNKTNKWEAAGLTALVNTGISPGITNVLVKAAADELDVCEKVIILLYENIKTKTKKFIPFWWSPEIAFQDMANEATIFGNGKYKTVEPFSNEEEYDFPGIGPRKVYAHEHEEAITLPQFIKGLKYVEVKMGGSAAELAKSFYDFGLLGKEPIKVEGTEIVPLDVVLALAPPAPSSPEEIKAAIGSGIEIDERSVNVVVEGKKSNKKIKYIYKVNSPGLGESFERLGISHLAYVTGIPAAAFTKLLIRDKIKRTGLFPPECLDAESRSEFLKEIAKKNITITQTIEKPLS